MADFSILQLVWFGLLGVLFIAYALLDGFDLGVGSCLPHFKNERSRRFALETVAPVWDGNEVWLLTAGGALFAAFPHVYASVFSGLYTALVLLLGMLIFRVLALELRDKIESASWRCFWDWSFCISSTMIALLLGVAVGNLVAGLPVDASGEIDAGFLGLLNLLEPIPLLSGLLAVCLLRLHGALFLMIRTGEAEIRFDLLLRLTKEFAATAIFYIALTAWIFVTAPSALHNFKEIPVIGIVPVAAALFLVATGIFIRLQTFRLAFAGTALTIVFLISTVGLGIFPNLVPAIPPENALTIADSASDKTLLVMLVVAILGIPLVLLYHFWVYRAFAPKKISR
ncbi:MAG: cytochrome d ubiquinol oxidase subunit II [Opitutales bacterium]|nr:cytochrome d ubiquinol oxidase subunit II [Opitutales bacterium]